LETAALAGNLVDVELTGLRQVTELHRSHDSDRLLAVVIGLVLALVVTGCGDATEPLDEWEAVWSSTISTVAQASTSDISTDQCQDLLGYLRVQRLNLAPVPLDDLEEPIDSWFTEAERIFFECDLSGDAGQSSLVTLEALEGEVAVVLEVER
jgi:hypothetical protein